MYNVHVMIIHVLFTGSKQIQEMLDTCFMYMGLLDANRFLDMHMFSCDIFVNLPQYWFLQICQDIDRKREKGRDLTQSYDKSPYTNRNVKRAK